MRRRIPQVTELRELLSFETPRLDPVERRLSRAHTVDDLRKVAKRVTPRAVFDYTDGAADLEITHRENKDAFARVRFLPRYLHDVERVDTSTTVDGSPWAVPFGFAPTGFTRLMHAAGEAAVAEVAADAGVPYALSTMATTSIEDVRASAPEADLWFQLYVPADDGIRREIVARAWEAGYRTLVLTVDTAITGNRLKDLYNGLTIPPQLTPTTFADMALHPSWWVDKLTTDPVSFANFADVASVTIRKTDLLFKPSLDYSDLDWVRENWPGKVYVKGIQSPEDAVTMAGHGVDGVILSNHGGRQMDQVFAPLDVLEPTRELLGEDATILLDSGVMRGSDVVAALALGADGVMVGRAYLYGLMAGGQRGVGRMVEILRDDVVRTMKLLGVTRIDEITREHVRFASTYTSGARTRV